MSLSIQNLFARRQSSKAEQDDARADKKYPYYALAFTRDTSAAALACAEALERPGLDHALIDKLLITGLTEHLTEHHSDKDQQGLRELAIDLLQPAKDSVQRFYQESKNQNPDFEDIIHSAHEECDLDFLQLVTRLYTQEFVRQTAA